MNDVNIKDVDDKTTGETQNLGNSSEQFDIAIGKDRNARKWRNEKWTWAKLVEKCSVTHYTPETLVEYMALPKGRQDEIKDVGGFVPGYLTGGRRKRDTVLHKQVLALDADFAEPGLWDDFQMIIGSAGLVYSTHKHTPEKNRLRLLIPLDRPVSPEEYEPIARKVAGLIDIEQFDHTTFDVNRLFYFPSTSKGAEFVFHSNMGEPLSADAILAMYVDWRDASAWPMSSRETKAIFSGIKKHGDPCEKDGFIGIYCRTYTIDEVIKKELEGIYEETNIDNRYTFIEGSTSGGAIVYDDKFMYSHHATDPISGKLCNVFDLVRIHKFGFQDEDVKPDTPPNRLPSYNSMIRYAEKDPEVRRTRDAEKLAEAGLDFAEDTIDWMVNLNADRRGKYETSVKNLRVILENDKAVVGRFGLNLFSYKMEVVNSLPWNPETKPRAWTDEDWAGLRCYLGEEPYNLQRTPKLEDVMDGIMKRKNAFHPVRDYLDGLIWDGGERLESVFIEYLGAEDNIYVRTVTRKALIACVARVKEPGCKFDNIPILIGEQGRGKSTLIRKMGGAWYSDNFSFHMLSGGNGIRAQEQIQGVWILEIPEMTGLRKAEAEAAKSFLSAQVDEFRPSHGRERVIRPRQVVPFGTSNDSNFLKQPGGNRRFWPVDILITIPNLSVWADLTPEIVDQIWAEADYYYREGEPLHLPEEIEKLARREQENHADSDDRSGLISEFLDTPMLTYSEDMTVEKPVLRDRVCAAEIWVELFGKAVADMTSQNTRFIHEFMRTAKDWEPYKSRTMFQGYGNQRGYKRK